MTPLGDPTPFGRLHVTFNESDAEDDDVEVVGAPQEPTRSAMSASELLAEASRMRREIERTEKILKRANAPPVSSGLMRGLFCVCVFCCFLTLLVPKKAEVSMYFRYILDIL